MKPIRDPAIMARVQMAFDLCEAAEAMMRQNLRRRFPEENEEQIEQRVRAWLRSRPDAEMGDCSGPVRVRRLFD